MLIDYAKLFASLETRGFRVRESKIALSRALEELSAILPTQLALSNRRLLACQLDSSH